MFRIIQDRVQSYEWPVKVQVPISGGRHREATFRAEFRLLPQSEVEEIVERMRDDDQDANIAEKILIGWKDVKAEDDSDLPFTDETKAQMLDITYVRRAIIEAYFNSVGGKKARVKN